MRDLLPHLPTFSWKDAEECNGLAGIFSVTEQKFIFAHKSLKKFSSIRWTRQISVSSKIPTFTDNDTLTITSTTTTDPIPPIVTAKLPFTLKYPAPLREGLSLQAKVIYITNASPDAWYMVSTSISISLFISPETNDFLLLRRSEKLVAQRNTNSKNNHSFSSPLLSAEEKRPPSRMSKMREKKKEPLNPWSIACYTGCKHIRFPYHFQKKRLWSWRASDCSLGPSKRCKALTISELFLRRSN